MTSHHEASEKMPLGLDRAPIDKYIPIEDHGQNGGVNITTQADEVAKDESEAMGESSGLDKLHRLSKRLQVKLQSKTREDSIMYNDQRMFDATALAPTLAPEPLLTIQNDRFSGKVPEKPSLPPLKEFVTKPIGTIKSLVHAKGGNEFAENVAITEVSHAANVNFVLAHERIAASTNNQARLVATQDFEKLQKVRQDSLVRWTMDRHVRWVTAVQAQRSPRLDRKDFVRDHGGKVEMRWLDYGHYVRSIILYSKLLHLKRSGLI